MAENVTSDQGLQHNSEDLGYTCQICLKWPPFIKKPFDEDVLILTCIETPPAFSKKTT